MDEPVSWKYYLATGVTAMIACFLSAVQGDTGVFFRVREILILVFRVEVQPLWVFVPAFLMGVCACWVERPKNSRSVLVAGLASFSLFGFAPYSKGNGTIKSLRLSQAKLLLHAKEEYPALSLVIRDQDFQIYQRGTLAQDAEFVLGPPGTYFVEVVGDSSFRSKIYTVDWQNAGTEMTVELEKISGWQGFLQKFRQAAREDRPTE